MRDIKLLTPECQRLLAEFAKEMTLAGLNFVVTSTLRTMDEQTALHAQGRKPLAEVNTLRKIAGMPPITAKENQKPVTWTMNSRHLTSNAFDIALILPGTKKAHWNEKISVNSNDIPDYKEAAEIGRRVGLKPGADFGDWPHYEVVA